MKRPNFSVKGILKERAPAETETYLDWPDSGRILDQGTDLVDLASGTKHPHSCGDCPGQARDPVLDHRGRLGGPGQWDQANLLGRVGALLHQVRSLADILKTFDEVFMESVRSGGWSLPIPTTNIDWNDSRSHSWKPGI